MDEEREHPIADAEGRRIFVEDVQLEAREGGDDVVVLFRKSGIDGLFGFMMEVEEPSDSEEPVEPEVEVWASVILFNLDEAVSLTSRGSHDDAYGRTHPEGVRWVW